MKFIDDLLARLSEEDKQSFKAILLKVQREPDNVEYMKELKDFLRPRITFRESISLIMSAYKERPDIIGDAVDKALKEEGL